jgi:hypothetical protein
MKEGTIDTCRNCGRQIEFSPAPSTFDENDNDVTPFWMRKPQWVDVDPPGEEVWNQFCKWQDLMQYHIPQNYCPWDIQSGGKCWSKVREPVDGLYFCGKHIKHALQQAKHEQAALERHAMKKWQEESEELVLRELRGRDVHFYNPRASYVPYDYKERAVYVMPADVLEVLEKYEVTIKYLEEELRGHDHQG